MDVKFHLPHGSGITKSSELSRPSEVTLSKSFKYTGRETEAWRREGHMVRASSQCHGHEVTLPLSPVVGHPLPPPGLPSACPQGPGRDGSRPPGLADTGLLPALCRSPSTRCAGRSIFINMRGHQCDTNFFKSNLEEAPSSGDRGTISCLGEQKMGSLQGLPEQWLSSWALEESSRQKGNSGEGPAWG